VKEISLQELTASEGIEDSWKAYGPIGCVKCGNKEEYEERYFILSRCPRSRHEEKLLDETMKKQYGVNEYDIISGAFTDQRGLINMAECRKCRSQDVFFDF
jgi:hypothetical protein